MDSANESTLQMTRSGPRLHEPLHPEEGEQLVYGLGFPLQVSATEVALLVNIRNTGVPVVDFENGWDIIVFDELSKIRGHRATKGFRNHLTTHPETGQPLTMVHHLPIGGFVPLGARMANGGLHPHQGTGFGVAAVRGYPADNSNPHAHVATGIYEYRQLMQFHYDGREFRVTHVDDLQFDEFLPGWRLSYGLSAAIADGHDLLFAVTGGPAQKAEKHAANAGYGCGLSRWRYGKCGWRPISFTPVSGHDFSTEPSLVRERDGSLLLCVRGNQQALNSESTSHHLQVFRSTDYGATWDCVINLRDKRAHSPVGVIQTVGGHVFLAGNPKPEEATDSKGRFVQPYNQRSELCFWRLTADRHDIHAPYQALDLNELLGEPRNCDMLGHDNRWYADHPIGGAFRLSDGCWHTLVAFRVSDAAVNIGGALPARDAGLWVEEVLEPTRGSPNTVSPWSF